MAGSFSQTIILGNVGKDPEISTLRSGAKVASISVATSESWKDAQTGERKERSEWHRVKIWHEPTVSVVERFVRKGSKIQVVGRNETSKWQDQEGKDRYTTEVVVRGAFSLTLLDNNRDGDEGQSNRPAPQRQNGQQSRPTAPADDLNDEIPW
ncbi:single-stranded DNA-binding protein [Asaia lannensis]|uniref:single-stranded DNA-binding protein n=1 Tax=Asaia lannensis TaxID=415421 RepID=UPI0038734C78